MLNIIALFVALSTSVAAQAAANNDALVAQLITASSQVARLKDIPDDKDFVFDFLNQTRSQGQGGFLVSANEANFPALLLGNGAMTIGVLGPCGLNSPHIHSDGTEIQLITTGGPVQTGMIQGNGVRTVQTTLIPGQATVFPKGSMHFQQNLGCDVTIFVASFDNVDPGALQIAQNFFALDKGVIDATLGEVGVDFLDHLKLPANVVLGAQECLDRCHIDRSSFNFSSTFADYIAFSNSTWTSSYNGGSSVPSPMTSASSSTSSSSTGAYGANNLALSADNMDTDIPFSQNPLHTTVVALAVTSAVLFLALLVAVVMIVRRRPRARTVSPSYIAKSSRGYPYATPYDDGEMLASRRSVEKQ